MNLTIGWFYPKYLNLYGDQGNVEILAKRARSRNVDVVVNTIDLATNLDSSIMRSFDLIFMGGGPDLSQQKIYSDFIGNKGNYLKEYLIAGGVGLFICGSYQLLGNYYKSGDGSVLEGLSFLDFYTQHLGSDKPRSIGNVVVEINKSLLEDPLFKSNNNVGSTLVGFENHGGRTYLDSSLSPLGLTDQEYGNNSSDQTEGVWYKNTIGTYLHGPVLARNPHLADFLLAKALKKEKLSVLDDSVIISAHAQSKELAR